MGNVICSMEVRIHYTVDWGSPPSGLSGPPENYDPGSGDVLYVEKAETEVTNMAGEKRWIELLPPFDETITDWAEMDLEEQLLEHGRKEDESDYEAAMDYRSEKR